MSVRHHADGLSGARSLVVQIVQIAGDFLGCADFRRNCDAIDSRALTETDAVGCPMTVFPAHFDLEAPVDVKFHAENCGAGAVTKYMVIETYKQGCLEEVYSRFRANGRMMPADLIYVDSWLERNGNRCFQLMETDNPASFREWTRHWQDLMHFEIVEIGSKPTAPGGS